MKSKGQPRHHLGSILLVFIIAEAVLSIEIGENPFQKEQCAFRILLLLLSIFLVLSLLLSGNMDTSAYVD